MNVTLVRFVKVMLFTTMLALLGPVLIFGAIMYMSPGAKLRPDINYEEHIRPLFGALAMWFGLMFLVGFVSFVSGLPKKFTARFDDRAAFVAKLDAAIRSVRYRPGRRDGDRLTYKPPVIAFLAAPITVGLGSDTAEVSAPRGLSRKLEKKLASGA
jgi:hypothetical protein